MNHHSVQLTIEPPVQTKRIHVLTRLALLLAMGAVGISSLYWLVYLLLPTLAALLILQKGGDRYLAEDAPRIVRGLRWLAAGYAYLWLLTDVLPTAQGSPVDLHIDLGGQPTAGQALMRWVKSLPALLLLILLSFLGGVLWVVGALWILTVERMPKLVADYLALTLRLQFRLLAYHLCLVDRYPSLEAVREPWVQAAR